MCKYFYTVFFLFLCPFVHAQTPLWAFNLGCATDVNGKVCKVAPNGNVLIAGKFAGTMDLDPSSGIYNITSHGLDDIYLACYTSGGTFLWGFGIGGPNYDGVRTMTIDANNNVIIAGYIQSGGIDFDPGAGTTILPYMGGTGLTYYGDGFVAKYSSTGVFQWAYDLGGSTVYDHTESLGTDLNGNVYVGGEFDNIMTVGPYTWNSGVNGQAYILKYTTSGSLVWAHNFGLPGTAATDCVPYAMAVSNGYIYIDGLFQGTSNFDPWGTPAILTTVGYYDAFIAKYDTNGNYVFAHPVSGSGYHEQLMGLALDASDNIYITGMTNSSTMTFDPSSPTTSTVSAPGGGGNYDIILAKYTNSGVYQWGTLLGSAADDYGWAVDICNGYLYCTGLFHNTVDMDPSSSIANLTSSGGFDAYITKYDLNGNYVCGFRIGSPTTDDEGFYVTHDASNNVYVTGQFGGTAVDFDPGTATYPLTATTSLDAFLVKYSYTGATSFTGHLNGDTICTGSTAYLTLVVTSGGSGPYTITYTDGTSTYTASGITSGVPFALSPSPTVTTTYSLISITPSTGIFCTSSSGSGFTTATVVVSSCGGCDSLAMPDSLHVCIGDTLTMPATLYGSNNILTLSWSPLGDLSTTTILNPHLTANTSRWYDLTVETLIPFNLVPNGDFSLGNTGFSSTYNYVTGPGSLVPEGTYAIVTNPTSVHPGAISFGDHTTGTGNMMAINGASSPTSVWCETIPVVPYTDYAFSAWVANWSTASTGPAAPILQFQIDGILIGIPDTINAAPGVWVNFYSIWNSGPNTTATICIYDEVTAANGNDFALDDISFEHLCIVKDSTYVKVRLPDTTYVPHDTSVCVSAAPITLSAPPGYSPYLWSTGNTSSAIAVSSDGNYWVYAKTYCAMRIDSFGVDFRPLPPAPVTRDTFYCLGFIHPDSLTTFVDTPTDSLNWYLGGIKQNSTPIPSTAVVTYPTGTTWNVSQTLNGCEGPSAHVTVQIIAPPTVTIISVPWVCQFDSISLSYSPSGSQLAGTLLWSLPPGATALDGTQLTDSVITVQFDSANNNNYVYLVSTYLQGECSVDTNTRIDVIALPAANAISKADVCLQDTVALSLSYKSPDAINFTWYVDNTPLSSSMALSVIAANSNSGGPYSISWSDTGTHIIHVQAFAEHGCAGKPTADTVNVHALPDATFRITTSGSTLCLEDSILFSANDSSYENNYSWSPQHFFNNVNKPEAWGRVQLEQSIITLTVVDPFGCTATSSQELDPNTCCTVAFPNAFTPNGDTHNDVFRPLFNGFHRFHEFIIKNRWGQTVFESTDNTPAWDGTFNGTPQDLGVYFYYLKYDCGGKTLEQKGDVTLIR